MRKSAIAIRHVHFEDLGVFETVLHRYAYTVRYCDVGVDEASDLDPLAPDLVIVLGGPVGAYEEKAYPFLGDELRLLQQRLAAARPTVGICLGAQLMARALGAPVYPGPKKEIGWAELLLTDPGRKGPFQHFVGVPVLHWHGDTFDLPAGAALLASTEAYPNQAFALGRYALACQFHPEIAGEGFERWLVGHAAEIASVPGLSPMSLRRDTKRFAREAARRGEACFSEWLTGLAAAPS